MTEKQQKKFYFPAWRSCCEALDWVMRKGRLQAPGGSAAKAKAEELPEPARGAMLRVLDQAEQLAMQGHRGVTAEDLRHACNLVATGGKRSSSGDMTNSEVDKVVTLFRLLQDQWNLDAVTAWSAYEEGEDPGAIKRMRYFIEHAAPEAYVRKVSGDKFGTRMWEWLELAQLRQLAMTIADRRKGWNKPVDVRPENIPF